MSKNAINPVTIRPKMGDMQVVIGRLHLGVGPVMMKTVQIVITPKDTTADTINEKAAFAVIDEDQLIDALGHLFPAGELAQAHMTPEEKRQSS